MDPEDDIKTEQETEEGVAAVTEEPEEIFSEDDEPEGDETEKPEVKPPELSDEDKAFNQEASQYDKEFGEAEKSYYPKAPIGDWDSDGKSDEEITAHIESVRQDGILAGMREVSRARHDGRDGKPPYDDAINDSGLREQWQTEQAQGNGPLSDYLEKKAQEGGNPFEVAYGLSISRLQKSGKLNSANGSQNVTDAPQEAPAETQKPIPKPGLAGRTAGSAPKKSRHTATSVAGLSLEHYEKLPVEIRERAKGNPAYGEPLPEV